MGGTVSVLGGIRFATDDAGEAHLSNGQRRLIAALALGRGGTARAEYLGEALGLAPSALRTAVSRLRALVGDDVIVTDGPGYRLSAQVDSRRFQELISAHSQGVHRLRDLEAALALWTGPALEEFAPEPWAQAEAIRLDELRLIVVEDRAEMMIALGRADEAAVILQAHVDAHPNRDRPWGLLLQALAASGRQADALRMYQYYRTKLGEESGTEPSAAVTEIDQRIVLGRSNEQAKVIEALVDQGFWSVTDSGSTGHRATHEVPTGVVTFLFSDVEASSALWAADADAMAASLRTHDEILQRIIQAEGGYVFATAGDSFAAAFHRASSAVISAERIQIELAETAWPGPKLLVRMGAHIGETEERDGNYFGPVLNLTARLSSAGHGGQTLLTEQVRAAASLDVGTEDLGLHRLKDLPQQVHIHQIGTHRYPELRSLKERKTNLPTVPTRLVGRKAEVAQVKLALMDERLVTITASGGMGKTRLATEVGEATLDRYEAGVWFVDLRELVSADQMAVAIALETGLVLTGDDNTAEALSYLSQIEVLLILDNCEHLVEEVADFAKVMLSTPGRSRILVTTREHLGIDGEHTIRLSPLDASHETGSACQLYLERAQASCPGFDATGFGPAVAELCSRLDGSPFAIEIAAARSNVMTPIELLAGIDKRFELLRGGRRRSSPVLENMLAWSYDLLDEDEQRALRMLGVFANSFDIDAAASVLDVAKPVALSLVDSLVAKSLVVNLVTVAGVRFRLLETTVAYAEALLDSHGERDDARNRHLQHYVEVCAQLAEYLMPRNQVLEVDRENLSEAVDWARSSERWLDARIILHGACETFAVDAVNRAAQMDECHDNLDDRTSSASIRFCLLRIYAHAQLDDYKTAAEILAELEQIETGQARAISQFYRGFLIAAVNPADTIESCMKCLDLIAELGGHDELELETRWLIGSAHFYLGDFDEAISAYDQALAVHDRQNSMSARYGHVFYPRAIAHAIDGRPELALALAEQAETFTFTWSIPADITLMTHLWTGDRAALPYLRAQIADALTGRVTRAANDSLLYLALLKSSEGDEPEARRLLLEAEMPRVVGTIGAGLELGRRLGIIEEMKDAWSDGFDRRFSSRRAIEKLRREIDACEWWQTSSRSLD